MAGGIPPGPAMNDRARAAIKKTRTLGPLSAERVKRLITSGKRPKYGSQQKEVRDWLRANKGWVGKNWQALNKNQYGRTVLTNAGFNVRDNMKDMVRLTHRDTGDKTIWSWAREAPYKGPPIGGIGGKKTPRSKASPNGGTKKVSPNGGTGGGVKVGGINANDQLLNIAIARLLSSDPKAGQQMLDPVSLLAGLTADTASQTRTIRSAMKQLNEQRDWNTGAIDKWFGQVGDSVTKARERGQAMTADVGKALAGNNAALLESIGGSAAMGASPVGQTMQQGQNTLAALGAADAQFLNDMGPLLQGEGASLKARELGRLAQVQRDYQDQLMEVTSGGNAKRAELALQIAQANNAIGQQQFQNRAGLAETLAGLAMSGQKISAQQAQFVTKLLADQDKQGRKDRQTQNKLFLGQLNQVGDYLPSPEDLSGMGITPAVNGVASRELVQLIRQTYRQLGLPLNDPRVINSMVGAIQTYGGKVPAEWVRGWRSGGA